MRRSLSQACAESPEVHLLPFAAAFGAIVSIGVVGRICVVQLETAKTRSCVGCDIGTNFGSLGRNGSLRRSFSAFAFAPHFYLHYKQPEDEGEHFSHMKANLRRLSTTQPNTWLDRRLLKASQDCSPSCCILHIPAQRSLEPCRTLELASYSTTFRNYFQKALRPRAQKRINQH